MHRVVIATWLMVLVAVVLSGAQAHPLLVGAIAGGAVGAWSLSRVQWWFGE